MTRRAVATMTLAVLIAFGAAGPATAALGDCSQPASTGIGPTASDCLYILHAAVGSAVCDPECICAPKGSLPVRPADALFCLEHAIGERVVLDCPCIPIWLQGLWRGSFAGDDSGTFEFSVASDGAVAGKGFSIVDGVFDIDGRVDAGGGFAAIAGWSTVGSTFEGVVREDGTASGTWENDFFGESGTWTGSKVD